MQPYLLLPIVFALLKTIVSANNAIEIDPKGYVVFCPCMGRFGNQVDHTLGVMNFARALDRTLVLPNFVEYYHPGTKMIPFELIFQVKPMRLFGKVVTMSDFVKHIMPSIWPKDKRTALCWSARESIYDSSLPAGCHAKEGSPFGPFWDHIGVDFVGDEYYGTIPGGYDTIQAGSRKSWQDRYSAEKYPVLAFPSAPAHFPSTGKTWENQRYLKWSSRVVAAAKKFIADHLPLPFVGVHLRNDLDWDRVCEHVDPSTSKQLFASAQCLGENGHLGQLTKDICAPSKETILSQIVEQVGRIGAKSVFVTSDRDHMLDEINEALKPYDVKAVKSTPDDMYTSLAILGRADMFIGNCVSTFSHIVKRERDFGHPVSRPTAYFGVKTYRKNIEL